MRTWVLACLLGAVGCDSVTEVVLRVDAAPDVVSRARFLSVQVFDTEGAAVVDRIDRVGSASGEVNFPAQLPLAPRDDKVGRTWRVVVEAQTALGCVFSRVEAMGGFRTGDAEERDLRLEHMEPNPCPMGPGCGAGCDDGLDCTTDSCLEGFCLNEVDSGCAIGGACLGANQPNPSDACLVCNPSLASGEWSIGVGCDAAEIAVLGQGSALDDRYGQAVAISGGTLVVGAPQVDSNGLMDSGAAYVFERDLAGRWSQVAELTPATADRPDAGANFGWSVAVSGDAVLVGAPDFDSTGTDAGVVFVFTKDSRQGYIQTQLLTVPNQRSSDHFGYGVDMDGDLAAVGAWAAEINGAPGESGAVHLFERNAEGRLVFLESVQAPDPQRSAWFGEHVAVSGNRVVAGAPFAERSMMTSAGAAAVFERTDGGFVLVADLVPSNVGPSYFFGETVAIDGDRVAVAALQDETFASDAGAVYVFEPDGSGGFVETAVLSGAAAGSQLGTGLAVRRQFVLAGGSLADPPGAENGGIVFPYEATGEAYAALPQLTASPPSPGALFGRAIDVSGDFMVVGAPDQPVQGEVRGAVYLFQLRN